MDKRVVILALHALVALAVAAFLYRKRRSPAWVLLLLAPMLGELLSGSSPPIEFFNPIVIVIQTLMYGAGALIVRELVVRWGKGWPTLLALGVAYAIAEEGIACKSFFDPNWMDLGACKDYGRWLGLNSVWTINLIFYHTLFSIATPILLTYIMFPDRRATLWLSDRRLKIVGALFVVDVVFCFAVMASPGTKPYYPPVVWMPISLAAIAGLAALARRLPRYVHPHAGASDGAVRKPLWFGLLGFAGAWSYFVAGFAIPATRVHPAIALLATAIIAVGFSWTVVRWSGETRWDDRHRLALISGTFALPIFVSFAREFAPNQPDNPVGQSLVGVATIIYLAWMWRRVRARRASRAAEEGPVVRQDLPIDV